MGLAQQVKEESALACLHAIRAMRERLDQPAKFRGMSPTFEDILAAYVKLADYGGALPSTEAWEAAMTALASDSLSDEQRNALLRLLQGEEEPRREFGP